MNGLLVCLTILMAVYSRILQKFFVGIIRARLGYGLQREVFP
jgi:hypothetical protein